MSDKKVKPLPYFATDEEAERFVSESDLTDFDLSGGRSLVLERPSKHRFEIYKDRSGSFRFRFVAASGKVVFSSEAFRTKTEVLQAIKSIRANADGATISDATLAA